MEAIARRSHRGPCWILDRKKQDPTQGAEDGDGGRTRLVVRERREGSNAGGGLQLSGEGGSGKGFSLPCRWLLEAGGSPAPIMDNMGGSCFWQGAREQHCTRILVRAAVVRRTLEYYR